MKPSLSTRQLLARCGGLILLLALCILLLWQAIRRYEESVYPMKYADLVTDAAKEHDVPPSLVYAVIHTESGFNPDARSLADAKGLMQITDDTYRWALQRSGAEDTYDPDSLFDPTVNIPCGVYILHLLEEQFSKLDLQLAAYNAGQGHVREWLADPTYSADGSTLTHIPYPETEEYIRRVLTARERYQQLYNIP